MSEERPEGGYSCVGCQFADPRFADPDDPDAECGYEIEGLCWKEVRNGKYEIWQDDFGNRLAIPTNVPPMIIGGKEEEESE